jgi:anaerobic dimethyl sulfoxide reductase subunit B (iron-sulfur subunit)
MPSPSQNQTAPVTFATGKQYGFYFDQGRCIVCQDCMLACMEWYGLPTGAAGRWMRVLQWETGAFPNTRIYGLAVPCYHCENPVCVDAANGAMYKESKYGAVLIDPAKAQTQSLDLRKANDACPYGAIVFDSDATNATAGKCTMCVDRLSQGLAPICVLSCGTRAWEFGPLADLQTKFGTLKQLDGMPDPSISQPAAVFKAQMPRKLIVPYDANRALQLWQQRGPTSDSNTPPVFQNAADITNPPDGLVLKNKPVFHYKSNAELIYRTTHDE